MFKKIQSFFDFLDENPGEFLSFSLFLVGILNLLMLSEKNIDIYSDLFYVMGIVFTVLGFISGLEIILRKRFNNEFLTKKVDIIIYLLLIVILLPRLTISNYNLFPNILIIIIITYSVRSLLFSLFIFSWRNQTKISKQDINYNASVYSFSFTIFILFAFVGYNFLFFEILILFVVYCISYLIRLKYLVKSVKSEIGKKITYKRSVFAEVLNVNFLILYCLLLMFFLYHYNFTFSESQSTILYFYSTTAQVFAALLGIIVMFSILILQKDDEKHDERNRFLKRGLIGFAILYLFIIFFSNIGIVISDTTNSSSMEKMPVSPDINTAKDVLSIAIFEFIFLMIPVALLYLYAMISDFLKWDATFEIKVGESIHSDSLKIAKGADRVKIEVKGN